MGRASARIARILFALMGAALGAMAVGLVESRAAGAGEAHGPSYGSLALADVALLAPLAMVIGAAVAAAAWFLAPSGAVGPLELAGSLRAQPVLTRTRTAAVALLSFGLGTAWAVVTAQVARRTLSHGASMTSGGLLAVTSVAWLAAFGAMGLALLPSLRRGSPLPRPGGRAPSTP